jgi:hypothetical protein
MELISVYTYVYLLITLQLWQCFHSSRIYTMWALEIHKDHQSPRMTPIQVCTYMV